MTRWLTAGNLTVIVLKFSVGSGKFVSQFCFKGSRSVAVKGMSTFPEKACTLLTATLLIAQHDQIWETVSEARSLKNDW